MIYERITKELEKYNIQYCFNEQDYNKADLKYIIVGDNPGKKELEDRKYFVGKSGQALRKHFENNQLIENFNNNCKVYNKTIIHTERTACLTVVKNIIGEDLFNDIQKCCVTEIASLANELKIPILVFGKTHLKGIFKCFWKELNVLVNDKESILVFSHPSYGCFSKEWNAEIESTDVLEKLNKIGRANYEKYK